jgi:hypothetical protein
MASPLAKLSLIGGKIKKLADPSNPVIKAQSKVAPLKLFVSRTVKADFLKGVNSEDNKLESTELNLTGAYV